jgi:hypothetical protein
MLINRLFSSFGRQVQRGISHARFARLLLVSIIALFAVISPQTAFAAGQPQIFTFHEVGSQVIDCGSFMAQRVYTDDQRVIAFSDKAGNPSKFIAQNDLNEVWTNLSTGFKLLAPGHFTFTFYPQDGSASRVGMAYHITMPGIGIVVLDAGRVTWDAYGNMTVSGPHDPLFSNDQICAALS